MSASIVSHAFTTTPAPPLPTSSRSTYFPKSRPGIVLANCTSGGNSSWVSWTMLSRSRIWATTDSSCHWTGPMQRGQRSPSGMTRGT